MGKNILLGITGGIAAYKAASLASSLSKKGHSVFPVMTASACEFISPLTFRTLTNNPVEVDMFTPPERHEVKHISLADKADLAIIAPATANFMAKLARGIADDLLSTIIMATRAKVLIAPAMNVNMYQDASFQKNLAILQERGFTIIEPESGPLACGYEGKGRMVEPEILARKALASLTVKDLADLSFLITAGPTREPLDPVRYLSNYSSGKMGYALAERAVARGAEVTLISGPTALSPVGGAENILIEKAAEMQKAVRKELAQHDIIIMAAAVSDFRPHSIKEGKIKKDQQKLTELELERNPDILTEVQKLKNSNQVLVGFAAESSDILVKGREKYQRKKPEILVVNDISQQEIGFQADSNAGWLLVQDEEIKISQRSKVAFAEVILDEIKQHTISRGG